MAEQVKTRYSDEELAEFKQIIEGMLEKARAEYNTLRGVVMHGGNNDIEDTSPSFRTVEMTEPTSLPKRRPASWLSASTSSSRILRPPSCASKTKLTAFAV